MPTVQQLIRNERKRIKNKSKAGALKACPQRRGVCTRTYIVTSQKTQFCYEKSGSYKINFWI